MILSKGDEHMTLAQLEKKGNVKEVVKSKVHLCADTNWKEQLELYVNNCVRVIVLRVSKITAKLVLYRHH